MSSIERLMAIVAATSILMTGCEQKQEQVVPANPEWVEVGETTTTFYVDPHNVSRQGDRVKMWRLRDHKTSQTSEVTKELYLSSTSHMEYDCVEERIRLLSLALFSDNMGRGKVVYSNSTVSEWVPIKPESIRQNAWKLACKKKP